jgi:rhamnosyl/mannosyltransferase
MVNKYYPPHLGGVEFHLRDLAEGLVEHAGAQIRAIVCNGEDARAEDEINGVEVVRLPRAAEFSSTPIAWGFAREIRAETWRKPPPDVLHFHFPYPWGELSWLRAKPDIPTVVTYHSDIVRQKVAGRLYQPFMERFLDRVDLIIASSPNMIEHSPFLSARAEKCRQVDFGLNVEHIADDVDAPGRGAQLRDLHSGRKIVLFVGRLVYYKGADVLVRAMREVDADLVMIGAGPLEEELRDIAAASGTADRVTFLDPVDTAELTAWYHAADVFALPSVARSEAFGLVQIEAHAAGTPVVSTNLTTGVPYANLDGVTGLTVPVGDVEAFSAALRRLLGDDELRERLGAQAKARALSDFTIPRMVDNTVAVYNEAIALHAKTGA